MSILFALRPQQILPASTLVLIAVICLPTQSLAQGTQSAVSPPFAARGATRPLTARDLSRYGISGSGVISPGPVWPADRYFYSPLWGSSGPQLGFPQPLGHQVIPTGPNGYIYRPVTDLGAFVERAAAAQRGADYDQVLIELEPVLTENPDDGNAWLIRAQALFGQGNYPVAAEALQRAMQLLPQEAWGTPVKRMADYFRSTAEYTRCLRALEAQVRAQPNAGAGHFLLGYHYGYLGYPDLAARELRTALRLMTGSDELAQALLAPQALPQDTDERPTPGLPRDEVLPRPAVQVRDL